MVSRHASAHAVHRSRPGFAYWLTFVLYRLLGRKPPRAAAKKHAAKNGDASVPAPARIWLVDTQVGVGRLIAAIAALVLMVGMAWHIIADTAAQNIAVSSPKVALAFNPNQPDALDRLALENLEEGDNDIKAAEGWASQSLRQNPLDAQALFLLGLVAEKNGDSARAEQLIQMAGRRSWRNSAAQTWLLEQQIRQNDFEAALPHADAMLRIHPELNARLFPLLAAFTTNQKAIHALATFLSTDPYWRASFFDLLATKLVNPAALDRLVKELSELKSPLNNKEARSYLLRLARDGRYQTAHELWQSRLPVQQQRELPLLYNGDFALPADGTPFNWTLKSVSGVEIDLMRTEGTKGRALRLQFSGARLENFSNVSQTLLLQPGRYVFRGQARATAMNAPRGVWWEISCATGDKPSLAHSDLIASDMPWSELQFSFEVPANGCTAQDLALVLPARITSEGRIEGEVWFRNLVISSTGKLPS